MSSPNETAEAILIVLKKILKWILFGTLLLVVVLFIGTKIEAQWEWHTYGKYEEKVTIKFVKFIEDKECSKEFPYMYVITNESSKVVEQTRFSVEVRRVGYSNVINSYTHIIDNKILKPNETSMSCFRTTAADNKSELIKDKEVNYSAINKIVEFAK